MKNQKNWDADHALAEMRLLIEGAVNLYEGDAMPLSRLAIDYGTLSAANAFDTIGTALYGLLNRIRELQATHISEIVRKAEIEV